MDSGTLFLDLFFGIASISYLTYAKKQQHPMALISGMGLGIFPFFVSNVWLTLVVGIVLCAAPFFVEL